MLLPLAIATLAAYATFRHTRPLALALLIVAGLAFAGTGDAILGAWGSDLAEAFGAYALGDVILFLGIGRLLAQPSLSLEGPHAES